MGCMPVYGTVCIISYWCVLGYSKTVLQCEVEKYFYVMSYKSSTTFIYIIITSYLLRPTTNKILIVLIFECQFGLVRSFPGIYFIVLQSFMLPMSSNAVEVNIVLQFEVWMWAKCIYTSAVCKQCERYMVYMVAV